MFPLEFTHLYGTNFLGVHVLLVVCDAVLWDVSCYFLSFCQRADPLVIIKLLRGMVLSPASRTSAVC